MCVCLSRAEELTGMETGGISQGPPQIRRSRQTAETEDLPLHSVRNVIAVPDMLTVPELCIIDDSKCIEGEPIFFFLSLARIL